MFQQFDSNSTNTLDSAIERRDVDDAKKILTEKPALINYINKKLYSLMGSDNPLSIHPPLDIEELLLIKCLLSIGADPNYTSIHGYTLLDEAVMMRNPLLVELLLKYGAHPLGGAHSTTLEQLTSTDNKSYPDYCKRSLPVQRAHEQYMNNCSHENEKIFNLLSNAVWKIYGGELEAQFKNVFTRIIEEVNTAHLEATRHGKRLMILIGEDHFNLNGFLIEVMTYLAASKLLHINTVLTEQDQEMINYFNETGKRLTQASKWLVCLSFENILKEHNVTIVPIDINHNKLREANVNVRSEEAMAERNTTMASCANEVKSDVVCVVGAGHLYGMLNKTDLESNFYVLPISTIADYDQIQKLKTNTMTLEEFDKQPHEITSRQYHLAFPEKVKNFAAFQHTGCQTLISPDTAKKIVFKLFGELKPKETNKSTLK